MAVRLSNKGRTAHGMEVAVGQNVGASFRQSIGTFPAGLLLVALLAGCGAESVQARDDEPTPPTTGTSSPSSDPTADPDEVGGPPSALVGSWLVKAAGEESGAVLRISNDISLFRHCGYLQGGWRASPDGMFIASLYGGDGGCFGAQAAMVPTWFAAARGFRITGDERLLLDGRGKAVATLRPGGRPTAKPNLAPSEAEPPVLTDELQALLDVRPAPMPPGLEPIDHDGLLGRWEVAKPPPTHVGRKPPYLAFLRDGTWQGSDGCNGAVGRWTSGDAGALLATTGVSTAIGCDNVNVSQWVGAATRAGLDGDQLVLVDAAGHETGRLVRAT